MKVKLLKVLRKKYLIQYREIINPPGFYYVAMNRNSLQFHRNGFLAPLLVDLLDGIWWLSVRKFYKDREVRKAQFKKKRLFNRLNMPTTRPVINL